MSAEDAQAKKKLPCPSSELAEPSQSQGLKLKTTDEQVGECMEVQPAQVPQDFAAASSQSDSASKQSAASNSRTIKIHPDLAEFPDMLFGEGASVLVLVGCIILFIGLQIASPDAASAHFVAAIFGIPVILMGMSGYLNDQVWRKRSSWVFTSQQPVIQRVTISKITRSNQTYYEVSVPAINDGEATEVLIIIKSSQSLQLLPKVADARVFRDPSTEKVLLVVLDSNTETGWRLWCREKALLGPGTQKDYWWMPQAMIVYFIMAAIMLFIIFFQNNAIADKARAWPNSQGKITQSRQVDGSNFCRYSYTVAEKQYDSDRISMYSRKTSRRYSVGEDVLVHYDPKNPKLAVLKFDGDWYSLCWAMFMLVLSLFSFLVSQASDFKPKGES